MRLGEVNEGADGQTYVQTETIKYEAGCTADEYWYSCSFIWLFHPPPLTISPPPSTYFLEDKFVNSKFLITEKVPQKF